ncbi:hypothetical protein AB205_0186140 [Aquarana catesbeiana]|uniref:Uncharacterized protein n=1 Tax=Aquarana catesbeiana TaxID=8400 RepID=A0A2G9Q103_AQUCT|nr:hypothetical protein AB205_0186140 [Aquarana catesbeiana]
MDPAVTEVLGCAPKGARKSSILGGRPTDFRLWPGRQVVNKLKSIAKKTYYVIKWNGEKSTYAAYTRSEFPSEKTWMVFPTEFCSSLPCIHTVTQKFSELSTVKNAVTYNTTTSRENEVQCFRACVKLFPSMHLFLHVRIAYRHSHFRIGALSQPKNRERALNLLLAGIPPAKNRWSIHTPAFSDKKLSSEFCWRHFQSCVRGIILLLKKIAYWFFSINSSDNKDQSIQL